MDYLFWSTFYTRKFFWWYLYSSCYPFVKFLGHPRRLLCHVIMSQRKKTRPPDAACYSRNSSLPTAQGPDSFLGYLKRPTKTYGLFIYVSREALPVAEKMQMLQLTITLPEAAGALSGITRVADLSRKHEL